MAQVEEQAPSKRKVGSSSLPGTIMPLELDWMSTRLLRARMPVRIRPGVRIFRRHRGPPGMGTRAS